LGEYVKGTFESLLLAVRIYQLGDGASILGLAITLLGFYFAFGRIRQLKEQLSAMNAVQDLNASIRTLEDTRKLIWIEKAWPVLPDRCTSVKRDLIAIRGRTANLTNRQNSAIQAAIQQLSTMEFEIVKVIAGDEEADLVRMNEVISKQLDRLATLVVELQREIERTRD
jgi:hypothetical protein